jgi:outer membrane protein assembly factor BamD
LKVNSIKLGALVGCAALLLVTGCGRDPYDNPIANNSQQPDKGLFDRAINDIEKHRYELGRITLQTLINTYPDSEYMAKAKLAIADSWYREGTSHALAQAEAEYKDFITFFPTMEESAESQMKVCRIHYEQMEKPDRDNTHAVKADTECRQMLLQYPNSRFLGETQQMLREIQEVIAEGEYRVGSFYASKGSYRAGVNRLQAVTDHYPLFSKSDEALWSLGNTYEKMGEQYQDSSVDAYVKLVRDYPLSPYVDPAKQRLTAFNHAIPESDPERFNVMKYNIENSTEQGMFGKVFGIFGTRPDLRQAAKTGDPNMTAFTPTTPPGVTPTTGIAPVQPSAEVSAETISGPSKLDTEPDARQGGAQGGRQPPPQPQQQQPQP